MFLYEITTKFLSKFYNYKESLTHICTVVSSKTNFHEFNFWKRSTKQMILEVRNAAIICIKRFRASVHKLHVFSKLYAL